MNSGHAASNGLLSSPSDHEKIHFWGVSKVRGNECKPTGGYRTTEADPPSTRRSGFNTSVFNRGMMGQGRADARGQCSLHAPTIRLQTKGIYSGWGRLQAVIIRAKNQYPFTPDSQGMPAHCKMARQCSFYIITGRHRLSSLQNTDQYQMLDTTGG